MRFIRKIIYVSTVLVFIIAGVVIWGMYGNPLKRSEFRKETQQYLSSTYPGLGQKSITVEYDFKEMSFISYVMTNEGALFYVRQYNGQWDDNYVSSVWVNELKQHISPEAQRIFGGNVKLFVDIRDNGKAAIQSIHDIPSYSEVSQELSEKTQITVTVSNKFDDNNSLKSCYNLLQWLVKQNYLANISFYFSDNQKIVIDSSKLNSISTADDLEVR